MARFSLLGDSYIKRLQKFCDGDLHAPGSARFVRQGGLRCDRLDTQMKKRMIRTATKSDYIFLSIGGNDISPISDPTRIYDNICDLVRELENAGVRRVFISEILPRADFKKSDPPGLTKSKFERDRKKVNSLLIERYGSQVIRFHDIRCPRDYDEDLVHLSEPTPSNKNCGIRKYFFRIRLAFCSAKF